MRYYFFIASICLIVSAFAQDSLRTVKLEEISVKAVRASETDPVAQKTINREKIRQVDLGQNPSVLIEQLSPSILSYSDAGSGFGNYNQFRLRGIDQTRINVTLNGVPLNDMVDQGVFFSNFADFSSSMESMQVQRGVGLTSNGTASYGGSVSFESIQLTGVPFGQVSATAGSFGSLKLNAEAATGRLKNDFAAYVRASRIRSDGYKRHSGSDAHSFFFSGAKFFENSLLKITAFSGKTQNEQAYLPVLLEDIKEDPRTNYFSRNDTDDFEQEMIQMQYSTSFADNVSWNVTGYYNGARGFFPFYDSFFDSQTLYALENNHYGGLSNVEVVGDNYSLSGGVHAYTFGRINETATAPQIANPYYEDETTKNELSGFVKANYDVGNFTFSADAQLRNVNMIFSADTLQAMTGDAEASRKETFFNPKVGVTYRISALSSVYASFGRTGREPTRTDLLQGDFNSAISTNNVQAFTNDDVVKSEYVNDIEAGYRYFSEAFKVHVNAFYMQFENEISLVGGLVGNTYIAQRQNVENSHRAGVELDVEWTINDMLTAGLQSTYLHTNVESFDTGNGVVEDVEHIFSPDWLISPSLTWSPGNFTLGIDGRYVSESFMELGNDPDFVVPSYFVSNMHVQWQASDEIRLGLRVNNVFDEQYFNDGAPVDMDFDGTPEGPGFRIQPPRHYFVTADFRF